MSDGPWIKFYPSDWLVGTSGMSAAEIGVYITLIMMMYEKAAPIALDGVTLARRCGIPAAPFSKILGRLIEGGKIVREGGGLFNHRVGKELVTRSEAKGRASTAGTISAEKRKQNQPPDEADVQQNGNYARGPKISDIRYQKEGSPTESSAQARVNVPKLGANDLAEFRSAFPDLDAERLDAIIKHRKAKRGQITGHAAKLFRADAAACGLSIGEAVDTCISRNWITVKPDWLLDRNAQPRGSPGRLDPLAEREQKLRQRIENEHGIGRERGRDFDDDPRLPLITGYVERDR